MAELLTAIKVVVYQTVGEVKREVFGTAVGEALTDIFVNGYEVAEEGVHEPLYQFIEYYLMHSEQRT